MGGGNSCGESRNGVTQGDKTWVNCRNGGQNTGAHFNNYKGAVGWGYRIAAMPGQNSTRLQASQRPGLCIEIRNSPA